MNHANIAIIGGGIGGLTAAIALQRKGFPAIVYEGAPRIKPLGAGLALAANAMQSFSRIGISEAVVRAGKILKHIRIKDEKGNVLADTDSEQIAAKFGVVNNFTIHRADLHAVLIEQLAPGTLILNKQCTGYKKSGSLLELNFGDGSRATADYVIAADGIHSAVRKCLLPGTTPRYAGYTCWRAVIDAIPPGVDPDETSETWGPGSRFGVVPLSDNRLYWFACLNAPPEDATMRNYGPEDLLRHFGSFHHPIPDILKATPADRIIWNDIIDLKPLKNFAFDNVVLTGDAAHATTPNMGQGACMAIEDAEILADFVATAPSITAAFSQFEKTRLPRTTTIVNKSWTLGKIAQLENRFLIRLRNAVLKHTPPSVMENQIRFLLQR